MAASAPSQILDGKYRVLRQLSDGGTVELYLGCTRGSPRRPVLIKRVPPSLAKNKPTVAGFLDEARTTARLQHPSILQVLDIGEDAGTFVAVFEYVFGRNVDELLEAEKARGGKVPVPVALRLVSSVLAALEYAHAAQGDDGAPLHLVHRDVSARNVLLGYDGTVKLGGFGLARHDARSEQTNFGVIRGQLAYVSPEQLRAQPLDARTDLWACGVLLYQLVTGALPFDRQGEFHILKAIREEPHKPASELRAGLPKELDALLDRALAKDPDQRFADAAELRRAIEETGAEARREALAEYAAELFRERLGKNLADAVAGRASLQAVVDAVGGTEVTAVGEDDVDDDDGDDEPTSAEVAPLPRPSSERQARPPSGKAKVVEPPRPAKLPSKEIASEPPRPSKLPSKEITAEPPPPTRYAPVPEAEEPPRERPAMPTAPPRQVARAPSKREVAAGALSVEPQRKSKQVRASKKRRFRLVGERGLNPVIYPAAVAAAIVLGLLTVRANRPADQILEPLVSHAPPLAVLDAPNAKPAPLADTKPVEPRPLQAGDAKAEVPLSGETRLSDIAPPPAKGTLHVDGPRGTKVIVDRHPEGSAPISIALAAGTHQVRYLLPNGGIRDEAVKIDAGHTLHRKPPLKVVPPQPSTKWP